MRAKSKVSQPRSVYLRKDQILLRLDGWLVPYAVTNECPDGIQVSAYAYKRVTPSIRQIRTSASHAGHARNRNS